MPGGDGYTCKVKSCVQPRCILKSGRLSVNCAFHNEQKQSKVQKKRLQHQKELQEFKEHVKEQKNFDEAAQDALETYMKSN